MPLSGIQYNFNLEWRLAAQWAGYKFEEFIDLPMENQEHHVAAYRCDNQIRAVVAQDQAREAEARSRARRRPPTRKFRKH